MSQAFDHDEIFKSLSHGIRREIVKAIGLEKELAFSGIKKQIEPVDSPTLSYHLKSLQPLLEQKDNKYKLSEIGKAAFYLLEKMDQSDRLKKGKRRIIYASVATELMWAGAMVLLSIVASMVAIPETRSALIIIILAIFRVINFIIFMKLLRNY